MEYKKYKRMKRFLVITLLVLIFISCKKEEIIVKNIKYDIDSIIYLNYTNAFINGFRVPAEADKFINISFDVENKENTKLFYKIYYQNESYKFDEQKNTINLVAENFYGSFPDVNTTFLPVNSNKINAKIAIDGNPRNEKRYMGDSPIIVLDTLKELNKFIANIKRDKKWLESVKKKADKNKVPLDKQIYDDAMWLVKNSKTKTNNRWQRNPRVGKYSLLLVLTTKSDLEQIPDYIQNIGKTNNGIFISPYYYFLYGDGKKLKHTKIIKIDNFTRLVAKPPLSNGIYIKKKNGNDTTYFDKTKNNSINLFKNAAFEYYRNDRVSNKTVHNIPVIADFFGKGYTIEDYYNNIKKYDNKRVDIKFTNSNKPGETFGLDSLNRIYFFNPPSTTENYKKENVGIITRHGFTYGKYTVKVKMSRLLDDDYVWTGLTNAIWLISQETSKPWNYRRECWAKNRGYKSHYGATKEEKTVKQTSYSEIDFEIVKAAQYWPKTSYKDKKERPEPKSNKDKVMVSCTNWDMSCWQPENYNVGANKIVYKTDTFEIHRWDHWYSALTSKVPEKDIDLFGHDYYYFQLEWTPKEIIWRIGPEKNKLHVVGYMNDKVTSIPNNQMLVVLTQEYHHSEWWPNAPFKQENIPFPAKKLEGLLYSIEIE